MLRSRLRLRLAAWFGVAFFVGLVGLDVGLYLYLHRRDDRRLTRELGAAAHGLVGAVRREQAEAGKTLPSAVTDALDEWPAGPDAFAVFDGADSLLGARTTRGLSGLVAAARQLPRPTAVWEVPLDSEATLRLAEVLDTTDGAALRVVAGRSTAALREYGEDLLGWLAVSVPLVTLFALAAGYLLARRSLGPIEEMGRAIGAIAPQDLDRRLPLGEPPDELDGLADQFNGLLARLAEAQARNRIFVAQAAHQLKTPLTIVRGESALGLDHPRGREEYQESLRRIQRAAEQMTQRVESLLLLAHAEAGERPPLTDDVELDGLALECADLMRGRARGLHRTLELERVDPVQVRGNEALLHEALLELIENALRHGASDAPVAVSAYADNGRACIGVSSGGPPLPATVLQEPALPRLAAGSGGLGLSIIRWIAAAHDGRLAYARRGDRNVFSLEWPAG
ncbi:MAG TPA: HAMP domain-containing sensor histidine kinase [Gemmatimonadales bacterium]|jgi:signal transduction histidine kinase|nr:HAMP domain-containing sensor histidine kinase [Gemmatimonadales bacterium]